MFVAGVNELEEQSCLLGGQVFIPDFIDQQHMGFSRPFEFVLQPPMVPGFLQSLKQIETADVVGGETVHTGLRF